MMNVVQIKEDLLEGLHDVNEKLPWLLLYQSLFQLYLLPTYNMVKKYMRLTIRVKF